MTNKIALALVSRNPNYIWLNFLNSFKNYDIYIFIDDNNEDFNEKYKNIYKNLNIIQIDDNFCKNNGYYNCLIKVYNISKDTLAWDKALFYFCTLNTNYDYLWIIEDDIFFMNETFIINIDQKYPNSDLLTKENRINYDGDLTTWENWWAVKDNLKLPWCISMVCACRLSKRLLKKIKEYVNHHNRLTYHEAHFNTLAYQNNFLIDNPIEFQHIGYLVDWNICNGLDPNKFYHPVKNINEHLIVREKNGFIYNDYSNLINNQKINFIFNIYNLLPNKFNLLVYKYENPDLDNFNEEGLIWHFLRYGYDENRIYKLPDDFNFDIYKNYSDLKNFDNEGLIWHYCIYGKNENRIYK